jgi:hypothetical protein
MIYDLRPGFAFVAFMENRFLQILRRAFVDLTNQAGKIG